jgi:hypothetical protein
MFKSTGLLEALLPDFVLDLSAQYGQANPRPAGILIRFNVVDENTTYAKARANIEALLALYGVTANNLSIEPGPEVKGRFNRGIRFAVRRSQLM